MSIVYQKKVAQHSDASHISNQSIEQMASFRSSTGSLKLLHHSNENKSERKDDQVDEKSNPSLPSGLSPLSFKSTGIFQEGKISTKHRILVPRIAPNDEIKASEKRNPSNGTN